MGLEPTTLRSQSARSKPSELRSDKIIFYHILMRFFYSLFFLFLTIILFFVLKIKQNKDFVYYQINKKTYKLLVADNKEKWERGLMFYRNKKELNGVDGMIFIFPEKDYRTFWNKNTYLDLDVYWINDDKIVGRDYLPSILKTKLIFTISSKEKVNKVIEIIR